MDNPFFIKELSLDFPFFIEELKNSDEFDIIYLSGRKKQVKQLI